MGTFAKGPSISWSISQTKWHIPNHPLPSIPSIPWIRFWAYSPTFCLNQFEYGLLKPLLKRPFQFWSVAPFAQMCTFTSSQEENSGIGRQVAASPRTVWCRARDLFWSLHIQWKFRKSRLAKDMVQFHANMCSLYSPTRSVREDQKPLLRSLFAVGSLIMLHPKRTYIQHLWNSPWSWKNYPSTKVTRSIFGLDWKVEFNKTSSLIFIPIHSHLSCAPNSIYQSDQLWVVCGREVHNELTKMKKCSTVISVVSINLRLLVAFDQKKSVTKFRALNFQRQPKLMFVHEVLTRTRILIESMIS